MISKTKIPSESGSRMPWIGSVHVLWLTNGVHSEREYKRTRRVCPEFCASALRFLLAFLTLRSTVLGFYNDSVMKEERDPFMPIATSHFFCTIGHET